MQMMKSPPARPRLGWVFIGILLVPLFVWTSAGLAADRHADYYYPAPDTFEEYGSRTQTLPGSDRRRRILFVAELSRQFLNNPYPPDFAIFAKGSEAEKLIITGLSENRLNTLFRMRALLALLTNQSRTTPIFEELEVEDLFNFLDLLQLLGFEQLTVTDGHEFAHQIKIRPGMGLDGG